MRWWILGAVLAGWAAAIAAGGFAGAAEPLRLEIKADRFWCTAGTVVEVDWRVRGGEFPYDVTMQGETVQREPVNTQVGTARVDCDALPLGAAGESAAHGEMIIQAETVDSAGVRTTATARVLLAPALPAPTGLAFRYWEPYFHTAWEPVAGAGSIEDCHPSASAPCGSYLLRYRAVGAGNWTYRVLESRRYITWRDDPDGITEMQLAALRRSIEAHSPDALNWSETVRYAAARPATSEDGGAVVIQARHDRLDVAWHDPDGHARATIELHGPDGITAREYRRSEDDPQGVHREAFEHLRRDQRYTLKIIPADGELLELDIMTAPPPADAPAALSLRLSANGSCTAGTETDIRWRAAGGSPPYEVEIAGVRAAGAEGTARIECGALPRGWRGPQFGYLPRTIRGTATDAAGATAGAETILLIGPPLAPPQVRSPRMERDQFSVPFRAQASEIRSPVWFATLRWRASGETAWSYNASDGPVSRRSSIGTRLGLASGTLFEAQVALGRSAVELEHPQALAWSESVLATTMSDPIGLVAEATHDSISLSWGPEFEGLRFIAVVSPAPPISPGQTAIIDYRGSIGYPVESGPPYGFAWTSLCPDTPYFISVGTETTWSGAPTSMAVATEPALEPRADGPMVAAEAEPDRITLRWAEGACVLRSRYLVSVREYGNGSALRDGYDSSHWFERSDQTHEITGLRPGSTYEIEISTPYEPPGDETRLVVETPERERGAPSAAEPPEFMVAYGEWRDGRQSSTGFRIYSRRRESVAELEWHVDGRRVRRLLQPYNSAYVYGLPPGWYEFRMRGLSGSEGPTRWSEPVRAATAPISPEITSTRYQGEHMIVAWDEPEGGVPIDRYILEWRQSSSEEWREFEVETGGWAAIPRPPFNRSGAMRLTAVSDEYGAGYPSADRRVDPPGRPKIKLDLDARGCGRDGSGTFDAAWLITQGVPPFRLRLRPVNSPVAAPETVTIEGSDREGRRQFQCADAAQRADGDWEAVLEFRLTDYTHHQKNVVTQVDYRSERFGATSLREDRSSQQPEQQLGQPYGEMPVPDTAPRSVHATHVKWKLEIVQDPSRQRWVARVRTAADAEWVEREMVYGQSEVNWWYVDDLEPGTRYEYAFGRYFAGGSEWSETGVVTTLEDVTGIVVSEADGAIVVEWDAQPDAWKYAVRLRGQGRSWWAIQDATDAARERIEFRAAGHGPYTAEVVTPPQYAGGGDISTFQLWPLPRSGV